MPMWQIQGSGALEASGALVSLFFLLLLAMALWSPARSFEGYFPSHCKAVDLVACQEHRALHSRAELSQQDGMPSPNPCKKQPSALKDMSLPKAKPLGGESSQREAASSQGNLSPCLMSTQDG